jgi:hypothetical protein
LRASRRRSPRALGHAQARLPPHARHRVARRAPPADRLAHWGALAPARLAAEEDFWAALRTQYRLPADFVQLESGYYSMQAEPVLEAFVGHVRAVNVLSSRYMRTRQADDKRRVRDRLARMAGVAPEELVVTRNTTESLDTVIAGHDWRPGDEAVMATTDYGAMLDMFALQARRFGLVRRVVELPLHPASDDDVVRRYAAAIGPRTRLLLVSHMVNVTGQVLPVRAIADMARARGVAVAVDGAHTFAQLDFRIPTSAPTTTPRRCTSGSARRSAPGSSGCAASASRGSGRCSATRASRATTCAS